MWKEGESTQPVSVQTERMIRGFCEWLLHEPWERVKKRGMQNIPQWKVKGLLFDRITVKILMARWEWR